MKAVAFPYQLPGHKILVTGASGFIGSHLCQRLGQGGVEVHGISRIKPPNAGSAVHWWQGDLAEIETVQQLLTNIKPDVIFHLASHVVGARELDVVMPTFRSNLMSTVNLMTVAGQIGCRRIIITGSLEEPEQGDPEAVPSSPYAAAKWAGSTYARMFHALYSLPVVMLRVFMVYGPAQRDLRKLIPYVILSSLQGEAPKLSSGHRQVDWIYVEDVVDGLLAAAQADAIEGCTIDIGSGELVPIRTVVEHLVRLINPALEPQFGALPDRPLEQVRVANTATTAAVMGWKPVTSLDQGLQHTVDWYKRQLSKSTSGSIR